MVRSRIRNGGPKAFPRSYSPLLLALKRAKIANSGRVATYLLNAFVSRKVKICSETAQTAGICSAVGAELPLFTTLRNDLRTAGFLDWSEEKGRILYIAGKHLTKYVHVEMMNFGGYAAALDLAETKEDVSALAQVVLQLIATIGPPHTEERVALRAQIIQRLATIAGIETKVLATENPLQLLRAGAAAYDTSFSDDNEDEKFLEL